MTQDVAARRRRTVASLACVVVGAVLLAALAVGAVSARLGGESLPAGEALSWSGEATYLQAGGSPTTCVVGGQGRETVDLPGLANRELVDGVRLDGSADGPGTVTCDHPVQVTTGSLLTLYPLAENEIPTVLVGGLLVVGGWVYRSPGRGW